MRDVSRQPSLREMTIVSGPRDGEFRRQDDPMGLANCICDCNCEACIWSNGKYERNRNNSMGKFSFNHISTSNFPFERAMIQPNFLP